MTKAKQKTIGDDLDVEDRLNRALSRTKALTMAMELVSDPGVMTQTAWASIFGMLTELNEEAKEAADDMAERWRAVRPAPAGALPPVKRAKAKAKEPKAKAVHWKTLAKQKREAAANGETQSLNLGGAE